MKDYDAQFDLRKRHPFGRFKVLENEARSVYARLILNNTIDVAYGPRTGQTLDVFPSERHNSPVFVFIHGGYFRALDKRQYSFLALPFVRHNFTVVNVNYDLSPNVPVREIVEQIYEAYRWIHDNAEEWNGDPNQIILCGHSVGALLAAKLISHLSETAANNNVKACILLSGLYDLAPVQQSFLNSTLDLTDEDITRISPIFGTVGALPTLLAVGENESHEFIRQSNNYADHMQKHGHASNLKLLANRNHY